MKREGKLFVFEGPDGNGKTTLIDNVYNSLKSDNVPIVKLSFPGKSENTLGKFVYELHHKPNDFGLEFINQGSLQTLHIAAHIESIVNYIIPSLKEGQTILLDRYWWSTIVYGSHMGLPNEYLNKLIDWELYFWQGQMPTSLFLVKTKKTVLCVTSIVLRPGRNYKTTMMSYQSWKKGSTILFLSTMSKHRKKSEML